VTKQTKTTACSGISDGSNQSMCSVFNIGNMIKPSRMGAEYENKHLAESVVSLGAVQSVVVV